MWVYFRLKYINQSITSPGWEFPTLNSEMHVCCYCYKQFTSRPWTRGGGEWIEYKDEYKSCGVTQSTAKVSQLRLMLTSMMQPFPKETQGLLPTVLQGKGWVLDSCVYFKRLEHIEKCVKTCYISSGQSWSNNMLPGQLETLPGLSVWCLPNSH